MPHLSHRAELMKLEYSLDISQKTSQCLLKLSKKTQADIKKILWECKEQMRLINDFSKTEAFYWTNGDQKYRLSRLHIDAETMSYELSKK